MILATSFKLIHIDHTINHKYKVTLNYNLNNYNKNQS